jgi:hypothetical protein
MPVSNNNRIFYACQAVAIEPLQQNSDGTLTPYGGTGATNNTHVLHGVQSVGINTTFNLEQVFELGQIHIYENIEGVPDVEVTLEKVLDGYPLMYHVASTAVATETGSASAKAALVARSKQRCNAYLGIFPDTVEHVGNTNDNAVEVQMSGMYISSIGFTMPVDGNCTESLTLVGNHKQWRTTPSKFNSTLARTLGSGVAGSYFDEPKALQAGSFYGGVQRRENFDVKNSILPLSINGVVGTSAGNGYNNTTNTPRVHLQNCSISCDLNRESIQELGRKSPYTRYANFPVEVTCEFEVISTSGDFIGALEDGAYAIGTRDYGNNTAEERILVKLHDGSVFDLGSKNRLSSINYTGGDAGGGNATMTYSYSTYNALSVYHPQDPAAVVPEGDFAFVYNGIPT